MMSFKRLLDHARRCLQELNRINQLEEDATISSAGLENHMTLDSIEPERRIKLPRIDSKLSKSHAVVENRRKGVVGMSGVYNFKEDMIVATGS